jgi:hypothetical protein
MPVSIGAKVSQSSCVPAQTEAKAAIVGQPLGPRGCIGPVSTNEWSIYHRMRGSIDHSR